MPIIHSLLDNDYYKFTMGQFVFHRYPDIPVRYGLNCRTRGIVLPKHISEDVLRAELDHVMTLRFTKKELSYLQRRPSESGQLFKDDYLEFLERSTLPPYELERIGDQYHLEFPGMWAEAIYWEPIALSIIIELYGRSITGSSLEVVPRSTGNEGMARLSEKIALLVQNPHVTFTDFGTRRRFGRIWHDNVVRTLKRRLSSQQFMGTSNVYLAMKYDLEPIGTFAHEMFMVMSGIMREDDFRLVASHNRVLQDWWDEYGVELSIALTDTYGTDFFFRDMTTEQARMWRGLRHDSGDPINFGEQAIRFYEECGTNPQEKLLVFSDGLDIRTMFRIADHFRGRIKVTFGWGTNLTNDLGHDPISLVIKATEANGHGTVKLSDNLAKAMGSEKNIERFKKVFRYTNELYEDVRY